MDQYDRRNDHRRRIPGSAGRNRLDRVAAFKHRTVLKGAAKTACVSPSAIPVDGTPYRNTMSRVPSRLTSSRVPRAGFNAGAPFGPKASVDGSMLSTSSVSDPSTATRIWP